MLLLAAGAAQAQTGTLYLTFDSGTIAVVHGGSVVNSFTFAYGSEEWPIAVYGDVRTIGASDYVPTGGQYTLGGTPTGTTYTSPSGFYDWADSTTNGTSNFLVDPGSAVVYQTGRDYSNATALFATPNYVSRNMGISYDRFNNSLRINVPGPGIVADYSMSGTLLSSFNPGSWHGGSLAFDPADQTLWLVNNDRGYLEQYSTAGVFLGEGAAVRQFGTALGGEFNEAPSATPEPGTLVMFGSGILGLAGVLRRKINL
jgi:hypothetical protein